MHDFYVIFLSLGLPMTALALYSDCDSAGIMAVQRPFIRRRLPLGRNSWCVLSIESLHARTPSRVWRYVAAVLYSDPSEGIMQSLPVRCCMRPFRMLYSCGGLSDRVPFQTAAVLYSDRLRCGVIKFTLLYPCRLPLRRRSIHVACADPLPPFQTLTVLCGVTSAVYMQSPHSTHSEGIMQCMFPSSSHACSDLH